MSQTISVVIFIAVIVLIVSEKVHRATASLAGAVLLLLTHVLTVDQAISYVDFNTIGVLIGMMIFVAVIRKSGMFEYISIKAVKMAKGNPWHIMVIFIILTALLSAFLDNVTTILLIGPMVISISGMLRINPVPILMTQILASNIGGTATLIGDPPNIMIGSQAGLSFFDFILNDTPAVIVIIIALIFFCKILFKKDLKTTEEAIAQVMLLDEKKSIEDATLLKKSVVMIVFVVLGFMLHSVIGVESSAVALTAGVVMLLIGKQEVEDIILDVEWTTIIFFVGLFIVVGGLVETGVINKLATAIINLTTDQPVITMLVLLWASALLSSILDNIPFVATLIPLIIVMQENGMDVTPLWWAISLGACLGGNGTLIGASANVVLSDISVKHGHPITFKSYLKVGFPMMIISVIIATAYLLLRYAI